MWNKGKGKADMQRFTGKTSLIAAGAVFRGDLEFQGAVQIDGKVLGDILTEQGLVRVSAEGQVEGEVRAPQVVIDGEIIGDVYASQHVELGAKARVRGNLYYGLMEMAMGAQVEGGLRPIREQDRPLELPESLDDAQ
ncbi:polymer-forming cytoskeletal protein [Pseudomonas argentinensis]|uniref:Protein CcmA, bactofilin family n=1 Tax=Phytopseudomonas argentinensis TaxID=289370 RepID=A0A1I3PBG4_9GAMM|nr:polymer-forming cytoskeletal protein [Pseudomonas argentinensis]KAB0546122.1 polymer-forming cytoskeletal protein [Pseudomonas argentinensis]SFJ18802.1 protein CcmA, bactofilin family [Pseudomonas argentinensis]